MAFPAEERRYSFADMLAWPEEVRMELVDGVPVMLASPSRRHQEVLLELATQLHTFLKGKKCRAYTAPFDVRLFQEEGDAPEDVDTVVEPDISVICDPGKLDDYGCRGAPDLVIEILSPSTAMYDRVTKFNLYQRAGVREYWIVDPVGRTVISYVLEGGKYIARMGTEGEMQVHVLEGCTIDLDAVFSDQGGGV